MVSTVFTRLVTQKPMVTAGLKCPPEMCPSAETMIPIARPWASAMPRRPRPPAPCKYWSVQIEPAPKKISANVPRNSAISFCDVLYIRKSPCTERICGRFERLHSSWNAAWNASVPQESPILTGGVIDSTGEVRLFSRPRRSGGRRSKRARVRIASGWYPCECRLADRRVRARRKRGLSHPGQNICLQFLTKKHILFLLLQSILQESSGPPQFSRPWQACIRDRRGSRTILEWHRRRIPSQ